MLALVIDARKGRPLYVTIADVKGAYDNVWMDALWAKLADDPQITLVETKRVRALYEHLAARIDEKDFKGPVVPLGQGVPQGGPHSGNLFCYFGSDLPEILKSAGAGTTVGEVAPTCTTYLDDSMIPNDCPEAVKRLP